MILDKKVTYFRTTRDIEVGGTYTIREVLESIKEGNYKKQIEQVRGGDDEMKKKLPTVAMHGLFEYARKKKDFYEASGLIILDIDDVVTDEIEETKEEIMSESDHVVAVMTSPSGNGIKVLYYVTPELITADNYRQIGKQIVSEFDIYGDVDYLSVTDCLIMTYDPNILINEDALPAFIYIAEAVEIKGELEKLDDTKPLWDDAEDFFDTVLANDIESKTNNNFHYIQVAILDLAKFGFRHPQEDLTFVIDYAESAFKSSPENKRRFLEVTELAKAYPQLYWPYKLIKSEEEDDEFVDYTQYMIDDAVEDSKDSDNEEVEETGIIEYEGLFEKVLEVIKEGPRVGREVSFENFANAFRFKGTGILTVTGIPSHGKTEFTDALEIDLARLYGEETIVAGFEQSPEEHIIKLIRKMVGVNVTCPTWLSNEDNQKILKEAYDFIITHFTHINVLKTGGNINKILEAAAGLILKLRQEGRNPRYLTLDPFNMLSIKGKFSGHEKIEEILRRIIHFSHSMDIMVILVAHPFKMKKDEKTGEYEVPDFYSVKGSSAFFEMSYHGLVVYRRGDKVLVKILKVKQNNLGTKDTECWFEYEKEPGRYIPLDIEGNELQGDQRTKDWLEKSKQINNNKK